MWRKVFSPAKAIPMYLNMAKTSETAKYTAWSQSNWLELHCSAPEGWTMREHVCNAISCHGITVNTIARRQQGNKGQQKKRTALNTQELHWNNSLNSEVLILHLAQQEILCFKSSLWCTAAKYALSQFPLRAMKLQANLLLAALQRSISFAVSYSAIMCLLGPEIHSPPGRG